MSNTDFLNGISLPTLPSAGSPDSPSTGPTPAQNASAQQFITQYLSQYGLGSLAGQVWQSYLQGQPINQILLNVRNTPEYKARYPAMADLQSKGQAWSESQYIAYEQQVRNSLTAAGVPTDTGFYEPDYIGKFISGNVSPAEVNTRIQLAAQAAKVDAYGNAAQQLYGVDNGHLTAFFLDPQTTQPLLEKKFGAIQAAGEANRAGFGSLSQQEAEYLSQFNMSQNELNSGFSAVANPSLATPLPGEANGNGVDRQTELAAITGDQGARQRIKQRQDQLASATQGSSNFTQDKEGSGIGSAQQAF